MLHYNNLLKEYRLENPSITIDDYEDELIVDNSDNDDDENDTIPDIFTHINDISDLKLDMEHVNQSTSLNFQSQGDLPKYNGVGINNDDQSDFQYLNNEDRPELINLISISINDLQWNASTSTYINLPFFPTILETSQFMKLNKAQHQIFVKSCLHLLSAWVIMQDIILPQDINTLLHSRKQEHQFCAELIGPAGFGKSKVIESIDMFATQWKKRDTLLLTAFTGNAAQNINGINMHAAFGWKMSGEFNSPISAATKSSLSRIRLVIVDEIGYCSQFLLGCVSKAMQQIFNNDLIMGGHHFLLVGDYLQMPPTSGLIIHMEQKANSSIKADFYLAGEMGLQVARAITYRVKLTENMRHSKFPEFVSILDQIRVGTYTNDIVDYLNNVCVGRPSDTDTRKYIPLITASNDTRFSYNRICTFEYAKKKQIPVFQIIAKNHKRPVDKQFLTLRDDQTSKVYLLLELCIGMPVTCTKNNKKMKMTNGTMGFIEGFEWTPTTTFKNGLTSDGGVISIPSEHPKFVFIQLAKSNNTQFGNLPVGILPIKSTSCPIRLNLSKSKSISMSVMQFTISPSWALTTDKVQGLTLHGSIVGPQIDSKRKNPPKQILYVAVSRIIDPRTMTFSTPVTLSMLNSFRQDNNLMQMIESLEEQCTSEFY